MPSNVDARLAVVHTDRPWLRTLRNAIVGVVAVTLAASVLLAHPVLGSLSSVVGGVVAGLLQGGGLRGGATVGALTGVLLECLILALGFAASGGGPLGLFLNGPLSLQGALLLTVAAALLGFVVVGLGCVVGGAVGALLRDRVVDPRR